MTLLISYMLEVKHMLNTPLNLRVQEKAYVFLHKLCPNRDILMEFFPPPSQTLVNSRNIQFGEVLNCYTTANHHNYNALLLGPPLQPKAKQHESRNKPSLVFLVCPFTKTSVDLLCYQKETQYG